MRITGLLCGAVLCSLLVDTQGDCKFPREWEGKWFQSGVQTLISVNSTAIDTKGRCVENDGDKFLIEDRSESCFRCVVIHERHHNLLQYKETFCYGRETLSNLCSQLTGDATLYTMFRSDAKSTTCPFRGGPPFTFTYNRGSGECGSPVSRVDSCTDESRLLLRYQACPDVDGTESTTEELVCLAYWKEGSTHYMVGKLNYSNAHTDEDRYRCFVYERSSSGPKGERRINYEIAQSGDATCNGLQSVAEGSRTIRLTKIENHSTKCRYPSWVTEHHLWHTLDHRRSYHFSQKNATLKIMGGGGSEEQAERVVCHKTEAAGDKHAMIVAHMTTGCHSGYVCLAFYKRDGHVIELQQSLLSTTSAEDACSSLHFQATALPYITLITATPRPRQCPYLGRYSVTGPADSRHISAVLGLRDANAPSVEAAPPCNNQQFETLAVGCAALDTMEFHSTCHTEAVSTYSCHGNWEDNGTSYLIASPVSRKSVGARRYCFIYTTSTTSAESGWLQVASVTESCHRNVATPMHTAWAFNLTAYVQCGLSSSSPVSRPQSAAALPLAVLVAFLARHER